MRKISTLILFLCAWISGPAMGQEPPPPPVGKITVDVFLKTSYTFRDKDSDTGVDAISESSLRYLGLDLTGEINSLAGYRIELAAAESLYRDPLTGMGGTPLAGPYELGDLGVRQAYLRFTPLEGAKFDLGVFMPPFGALQERRPADWVFADPPLYYTHPSFHRVGWQNAGVLAGVDFVPLLPAGLGGLNSLRFDGYVVNGYLPEGLANADSPFPESEEGSDMGAGLTLSVSWPGLAARGGLYWESFGEDVIGGPDLEQYSARAYTLGIEARTPYFWMLAEFAAVMIDDYQLTDTLSREDLTAMGAHLSAAIMVTGRLDALARWEWIEPNGADRSDTIMVSEYDQVTRLTMGFAYRPMDGLSLVVNYVMPVEDGDRVDLDRGHVDGKYRNIDDNYLRVDLSLSM